MYIKKKYPIIALVGMMYTYTLSSNPIDIGFSKETFSVVNFNSLLSMSNLVQTAANVKDFGKALVIGSSQLLLQGSTIGQIALAYPRTATLLTGAAGLIAAGRKIQHYYDDKECPALLKETSRYTQYLKTDALSQIGKPSSLMYWRNGPASTLRVSMMNQFDSPATMLKHAKSVREKLLSDFKKEKGESDSAWKDKLLLTIDSEKAELIKLKHTIEKRVANAPLLQFINKALSSEGLEEVLMNLTAEKIAAITKQIENYYSWWRINYTRWGRWIVESSYEASLVKEYWKLCVLLSRLDALERIVDGFEQKRIPSAPQLMYGAESSGENEQPYELDIEELD